MLRIAFEAGRFRGHILDGVLKDALSGPECLGDLPHEEIEPEIALGPGSFDLVGRHRRGHRQEVVHEGRERFGKDEIVPLDPSELAR